MQLLLFRGIDNLHYMRQSPIVVRGVRLQLPTLDPSRIKRVNKSSFSIEYSFKNNGDTIHDFHSTMHLYHLVVLITLHKRAPKGNGGGTFDANGHSEYRNVLTSVTGGNTEAISELVHEGRSLGVDRAKGFIRHWYKIIGCPALSIFDMLQSSEKQLAQ